MKTILHFSLISLFCSTVSVAQQTPVTGKSIQDSVVLNHMPEWAISVLEKSEIAKKHKILDDFNPYYFESDFNGDKFIDIAFFVENTVDHTKGVLIINGGKNITYVLGCGNTTQMGSSIEWAKHWMIFREKIMRDTARKSYPLKTPAIVLKGTKDYNMIIYWSRNKYKTLMQQS